MKIVFAGTPDFAVNALKRIVEDGYEVVGIIAQPDKPKGRKGIMTPPPVKVAGIELNIPVIQPEKIRNSLEEVKSLGGDIMITCAYGQILSDDILKLFPLGVWNIHASLLPFYRGASPIQSCVLNGEEKTGVTIMKTETGLDTGDILNVIEVDIDKNETFGELSDRLSFIGADAISKALPMLEKGDYKLIPQDESKATIVKKINKSDAKINYNCTAEEIVRLILGMNPNPGAYTESGDLRINVYRGEKVERPEGTKNAVNGEVLSDSPKKGFILACKDGAVKFTEVQSAGGKKMKGNDFLNGRKVVRGQIFL